MSIYYSELLFSIDLIRDAYKTNDVALIRRKLKSDMQMSVSIAEILKCITPEEKIVNNPLTISMQELFNEQPNYETG